MVDNINPVDFTRRFFKGYFKIRSFIFKQPKIKVKEGKDGVDVKITFEDDQLPEKTFTLKATIPYKIFFQLPERELETYHITFLNSYIHQTADVVIKEILNSGRVIEDGEDNN